MQPLKIILYGKPGSGKDTQAELLAKKYGLLHFSGGALLRDEVARETALGKEIKHYLDEGVFVPKGIVGSLMKEKILNPATQSSGYILQGYPRSAESFLKYLTFSAPDAIFILDISNDTAMHRLRERQRSDDYSEAIQRRLRSFQENDEPLFLWFKEQNIRVIHINADQEKMILFAEICSHLSKNP